MRLLVIVMIYCLEFTVVYAQKQNPVEWNFSVKNIDDKKYEIRFSPKIKSPWHIYSQNSAKGAGLPTSFHFQKNPLIKMEGKVKEIGQIVSKYEDVFEVTTKYFKGKVDFILVVTVKSQVKTKLTGKVVWMACTDEQCLPPDEQTFSIALY